MPPEPGTLLLVFLRQTGGRGALIKAPIRLQDLEREDLHPGEDRLGWTGWTRRGLTAPQPKAFPVDRSHNPGCEAGRTAECGKSARSV
jgi:hypothetical protein